MKNGRTFWQISSLLLFVVAGILIALGETANVIIISLLFAIYFRVSAIYAEIMNR
jgi:uncharacterized membrane protein HdeD (DUF308 family)